MNYTLKNIFNFEGMLFLEGTMVIRTLFKSDETKKKDKKRIARQHKLNEGEERKIS